MIKLISLIFLISKSIKNRCQDIVFKSGEQIKLFNSLNPFYSSKYELSYNEFGFLRKLHTNTELFKQTRGF